MDYVFRADRHRGTEVGQGKTNPTLANKMLNQECRKNAVGIGVTENSSTY